MILSDKNSNSYLLLSIIGLLMLIVAISHNLFYYNPQLTVTEKPPNIFVIKYNPMIDNQVSFRAMALSLQYMGDSYGRSSFIGKYDYKILYDWFKLLDLLDKKSDFTPSIAAYYFGYNHDKKQLGYVVKYLSEHSSGDLENKWWWLYQASYLAYHRTGDYQLAIELAQKVASTKKDIPIWARELPALYYAKTGEYKHAMHIIENILARYDGQIKPGEKNYIDHFLQDMLEKSKVNHD